jgi:hypothetical protein
MEVLMLSQLKSLIRFVSGPSLKDIERAYLEGAASRYDLECRERDIDAGRFRQRAFAY